MNREQLNGLRVPILVVLGLVFSALTTLAVAGGSAYLSLSNGKVDKDEFTRTITTIQVDVRDLRNALIGPPGTSRLPPTR